MKKLIVWAVLSAAVAVLPSCGDDEGEGCSTPVISEVNYSPKNPSKSEEVTVTARIRNEHCPFQACVTYQEVTTQHRLYVSSDFEEYVVPGPIEPDPDQPGDSGESDGSEK